MSPEVPTPEPRLTGVAAYKAELSAIAQRNAEAKRSAGERKSPEELALVKREHRLDQVETRQLEALNKKLDRRQPRRAS